MTNGACDLAPEQDHVCLGAPHQAFKVKPTWLDRFVNHIAKLSQQPLVKNKINKNHKHQDGLWEEDYHHLRG